MQDKQENNGVELENSTLANNAKGNVCVSPALGHPVGHKRGNRQSGGDRSTLKVFRLSSLVLGQNSHGNVEASQAGQAAEDEEGQEEVVERGANTHGERGGGGGEAEGDLRMRVKRSVYIFHIEYRIVEVSYQVRKRVKLLSHQRGLLAPPSDLAVHKVEEQTEWHECEGGPQSTVIGGIAETVTHGGEDRHDYFPAVSSRTSH